MAIPNCVLSPAQNRALQSEGSLAPLSQPEKNSSVLFLPCVSHQIQNHPSQQKCPWLFSKQAPPRPFLWLEKLRVSSPLAALPSAVTQLRQRAGSRPEVFLASRAGLRLPLPLRAGTTLQPRLLPKPYLPS